MRVRTWFIATLFAVGAFARGAESPVLLNEPSKFLGATSCSSSGCHGGAGQNQNQSLTWSLKDFHSQRPFATLTTARSKQIADALKIKDPAADARCTSCHAPLATVAESQRGPALKVSEGVSCESCHGPAENWLRAHTRPDWTQADRTFAGLRNLKNLYVRANTCIACHETVETPLLQAGHPELAFELDGQSVAQPRHWREGTNWSGAQSWLVGQAVALRELSWQVSRETAPDEKLVARWSALLWLLQQVDGLNPALPKLGELKASPQPANARAVLLAADRLAQRAAETPWTDQMSRAATRALVATGPAFQESRASTLQHAYRAERLVLALDRLLAAGAPPVSPKTGATLDALFRHVQSRPDFAPASFATDLDELARTVGGNKGESE